MDSDVVHRHRQFILVEVEGKVARGTTTERVRRVAGGYTKSSGGQVKGLGGGFRFCELGESLFDENGKIREAVRFADLARHVYFSETGEPLPRERVTTSPFLGGCRGVGIYLLYNGILKDKNPKGGNVLTRETLSHLPPHDGPKVVFGTACTLSPNRLKRLSITFRQIPYQVRIA